ncbi:secreted EGF-like protein [Yokapox virus]|uniref:Secreted EGF-like protein n=1 Tax=Yokapox virus TaxID=1076255 RepID=G3EI87_9POXV|nr:secreted EGF-like protein [Yokapox virus]AEN03598.1 secreted EGF-like protein [Yokapox virus]
MNFKYIILFCSVILISFATNITQKYDYKDYCIMGEINNITIKGVHCKCAHKYTGIRCHHIILSDF